MRGLAENTKELLAFAYKLLEESHPMNLRQLHYAIFSAAKIAYENATRDYRRLSRATTDARNRYRDAELKGQQAPEYSIPPRWIVDELREAVMPNVWEDVTGYIDCVKASYRRDLWQDQPAYCEVWSEKAASLATLRPVTQELGVMLRPCRGFGSSGMKHQIGYLFEGIEKPIHIFYLGDFDPSGGDIEQDVHVKTERFSGRILTFTRLAIFRKDIKRFNLPPQKIKDGDPRAKNFKQKYGKNAPTVELDALPVEELRTRVRAAIEGLIDLERWNRQAAIQEKELKSISYIAEQMKKLPKQS